MRDAKPVIYWPSFMMINLMVAPARRTSPGGDAEASRAQKVGTRGSERARHHDEKMVRRFAECRRARPSESDRPAFRSPTRRRVPVRHLGAAGAAEPRGMGVGAAW